MRAVLTSLTGLLRVMSERHHATDVVFGAGVGLAAGLLLPWLFHFRIRDDASAVPVVFAPWVDGERAGAQAIGLL